MLHLHRAERTDRLADGLAAVLAVPPDDPFTAEVVAVPTRGIERWLTQRLSHRLGAVTVTSQPAEDGVCANVTFPSPVALVADAVEDATGIRRGEDPWRPEPLVWSVLHVVDASVGEPWCATLGRHVGVAADLGADEARSGRARRYATAATVAGLFATYGAQRPAMLRAWASGTDTDGAGAALSEDARWQAELWRRVRAAIGTPAPAERLGPACEQLEARPGTSSLPPRLSVFGATRLTADQVAVLDALARHRDVHLWLPHPSPQLWHRLAGSAADARPGTGVDLPRRRADPTAAVARNPLLSSFGRDSRELQVVLARAAPDATDRHDDGSPVGQDLDTAPPPEPTTLLARLHQAVRLDAPPPPPGLRPPLRPDDRSVAVHACHGRARQVEVLREVLLGLLADDPTLQPRDVLVMCPDIEAFAPLVTASFGLGDGQRVGSAGPGSGPTHRRDPAHPGHGLRVRLADRSLRQTNPVLAVAAAVLELADSRVDATQVLDLAAMAPVRRRFGLGDDDLERLRLWVAESGVRWGLDHIHRGAHGSTFGQNTWRAGLDRILLGVAMTGEGERFLDLAVGLDDVDSGDIVLTGRLAELLDRVGTAVRGLAGELPLSTWVGRLMGAVESLVSVDGVDGWQLTQARSQLSAVDGDVLLGLGDVRAYLGERLAGRPTRANFRTGDLTLCSLVPMRSVPHRVVVLLGLDDRAFAGSSGRDGDDILAVDPVVGERDRRSETRQMILDAVLAAREHLVVVYTGADERTGEPLPPAVPIGELLDAADSLCRVAEAADGAMVEVRDRIVVRHPLQPYDPRNFRAGALGGDRSFSFDALAAQGARSGSGVRRAPGAFLPAPLSARVGAYPSRAAPSAGVITMAALVSFLEHPVRAFLRGRLDVEAGGDADQLATDLTVEVPPLQLWAVGERMLRARLAGTAAADIRQAEWRRGALPPGALGAEVLDRLAADVDSLATAAGVLGGTAAEPFDVAVELPGDRLLSATVGVVTDETGPSTLRVTYSRLGPKHRLRAWAHLLALAATRPGPWRAVTIGRTSSGSARGLVNAERSTLVAPDPEAALRLLVELVDLYDAGMREPLPLVTKASCAYATGRDARESPPEAQRRAAREWLGRDRGGRVFGEATEAEHVLVHGGRVPLEQLLDQVATEADGAAAWPQEHHRFGVLARRLWAPLIATETRDRP